MLGLVGAHYVEMVVVAMSLFAAGLFLVSISDALHGKNRSGED